MECKVDDLIDDLGIGLAQGYAFVNAVEHMHLCVCQMNTPDLGAVAPRTVAEICAAYGRATGTRTDFTVRPDPVKPEPEVPPECLCFMSRPPHTVAEHDAMLAEACKPVECHPADKPRQCECGLPATHTVDRHADVATHYAEMPAISALERIHKDDQP